MEFTVNKPKTRKVYSYVLKSSLLQQAIDARQLKTSIYLAYWTPHKDEVEWTLVKGDYWFPNQHVNYPRFSIQVGAVPVHLKPKATELVQTAVLPQLIDWMAQQEQLDSQSTLLKTHFQALLKDGALLIR